MSTPLEVVEQVPGQAALFAVDDEPAPADLPTSPDRRRTQRQADLIRQGRHPLTGGELHPDAPRGLDRTRHSEPFTCGSCALRTLVRHHSRFYPKCGRPDARVTNGPASDVRAWWPACPAWEVEP